MNGPAGIRLDSVSKQYTTPAGPVRAVDGITLEVEPGHQPRDHGSERLREVDPARADRRPGGSHRRPRDRSAAGRSRACPKRQRARLRRDELGLVFQSDNLLPFLTAVENVGLQLALQRRGRRL